MVEATVGDLTKREGRGQVGAADSDLRHHRGPAEEVTHHWDGRSHDDRLVLTEVPELRAAAEETLVVVVDVDIDMGLFASEYKIGVGIGFDMVYCVVRQASVVAVIEDGCLAVVVDVFR